ncbi:MAG TPA: hypothetical protein VMZ22_05965 [Acidimicrobiales bacterium]|nr:hypothetical protein [Acidimicrobiales bacterium]
MQLEWTEAELLETHEVEEPLFAAGVKCHGGFAGDGNYVSPRTKNRWTAIDNWKAEHKKNFGTDVLDIGLDRWPAHYPNVAQAKFLLAQGVTDPMISTITRVGTVEGFGAFLRYSPIPDLQANFLEPVAGTAMAHLGGGLFEAHARDEAGYEDEGGHKQMWFAARDLAFESPVTDDQVDIMLARMGIGQNANTKQKSTGILSQLNADQMLPDIDADLESLLQRMTSLLLIEISAFHIFAFAEEVLADTQLTAGDGEAAKLVSYIRADETPHVEYLKTTLTEMRDRTFIGKSGKHHSGAGVVGAIWDRAVANSLGPNRQANLQTQYNELKHALSSRKNAAEILEGYHALGDLIPNDDQDFVPAVATY